MNTVHSRLCVRYCETDAMGIVYHANYLTWFEIGRLDLLQYVDCSYKDLEAEGLFVPVLSVQVDYISPARFDDSLDLYTEFKEHKRARFAFAYQLFREKKLLCRGTTWHNFMNVQGRPIRPPQRFLQSLEQIKDTSAN